MQTPLQITFRDMDASPALEHDIRNALLKLEEHCERITFCHVVVEAPHKHRRRGRLFHVRIELALPGRDIVIAHPHGDRSSHEDAYVAVHDAFRAARRALDAHIATLRASHRAA